MLVDNKFLYVSLPRCGSTSFHYSCILSGLDVKNLNFWDKHNDSIDFKNIDESKIMDLIAHGHESLMDLKEKFGNHLPVIAVNRDRHDSFFSLYKHVIFDLKRTGWDNISDWLSKISIDELFFFNSNDLTNIDKRWKVINEYMIKNGFIEKYIRPPRTTQYVFRDSHLAILSDPISFLNRECYLINIFNILITPKSIWHNNDKNITWFNIDEMSKLQDWVSNITGKKFILKHVNSNSDIKVNLELNDQFKNKYNSIYDHYDLPKNKKTLI